MFLWIKNESLFIMPLALTAYLFQLAVLSAFLKLKGYSVRYEELVTRDKLEVAHFCQDKNCYRRISAYCCRFQFLCNDF